MIKRYFLVLLLVFMSCEKETPDEESGVVEEKVIPELVTQLFPEDYPGVSIDISQRVIQGIVHFENGWFVSQTLSESMLLINYLDENGNSLYYIRIPVNSHGQDLSIEKISDDEIYLYTTSGTFSGTGESGILKIHIYLPQKINGQRDWAQTTLAVEDVYDLGLVNSTPTYNQAEEIFYVRSKNSILAMAKADIENGSENLISHFELNPGQLTDNGGFSMWFQGITTSNDAVFCLTGNEKIGTYKKIYKYDKQGIVLKKYIFDRKNVDITLNKKLEPEGLDIKDGDIYFSIMTRNEDNTANDKFLYKLQP